MGHGRGFAAAGDVDALGRRESVDVVEVEGEGGGVVGSEGVAVGKAGEGVDAGDAGKLHGGVDNAA